MSISARTTNMADGSVMGDAPVPAADCCARCGTPGVQTAAWVCGVCKAPFVINGEPMLSLDGVAAELGEVRLYCEHCRERQPPLEHPTCSGCSRAERRIRDVLEHNRRERDHAGHDDGGHDEGEDDYGGRDDGGGEDNDGAAEAAVDVPAELPDDGITIDEEIKDLLPQQSHDEYIRLEAELAYGCSDKLVVWQDGPRQVLLDGHLRRAICRARHIPYENKIQIQELPDRSSAIKWVIQRQLARRNLAPEALAYLRGRIYNLEKRQGARTDLDTSRQGGEKLSERLAEVYRVGGRTIERDGQFATQLDQLAATYGVALRDAMLAPDDPIARFAHREHPSRAIVNARVAAS